MTSTNRRRDHIYVSEEDEVSTYYKRFRAPITSAQVVEGPGHDHVHVFEREAKAGVLVVTKGSGCDVALMFADEDVIQVHAGPNNTLVRVDLKSTSDDEWVISDNGRGVFRAKSLPEAADAVQHNIEAAGVFTWGSSPKETA